MERRFGRPAYHNHIRCGIFETRSGLVFSSQQDTVLQSNRARTEDDTAYRETAVVIIPSFADTYLDAPVSIVLSPSGRCGVNVDEWPMLLILSRFKYSTVRI